MIFALLSVLLLTVLLSALVVRQEIELQKLRPLRDKQPVCGCKHHLSYHDKKTGVCNNYEPGVEVIGTGAKITCKCKQYVGPERLQEYFVPEIADD